jgi:hypothetical protein
MTSTLSFQHSGNNSQKSLDIFLRRAILSSEKDYRPVAGGLAEYIAADLSSRLSAFPMLLRGGPFIVGGNRQLLFKDPDFDLPTILKCRLT